MELEKVNQYLNSKGLSWGEVGKRNAQSFLLKLLKKMKQHKAFVGEYPVGEAEDKFLDWLFYSGPEIEIANPVKFLEQIGVTAEDWFTEGEILQNSYVFCVAEGEDSLFTNIADIYITRNKRIPEGWSEEFLNKHFPQYKIKSLFNKTEAEKELIKYVYEKTVATIDEIENTEKLNAIIKKAARIIHETNKK